MRLVAGASFLHKSSRAVCTLQANTQDSYTNWMKHWGAGATAGTFTLLAAKVKNRLVANTLRAWMKLDAISDSSP